MAYKHENVIAVFLDLPWAFDSVNRLLLLTKLARLGFCGTVLQWFKAYLQNRRQNVKHGMYVYIQTIVLCLWDSIRNSIGVIMLDLQLVINDVL